MRRTLSSVALALLAIGQLGGKEVVLTPAHTFTEDDAVVDKALDEELARSMRDLRLGDSPRPYYLAYALSDIDQAVATATFGAVTGTFGYRGRTLRTDVRVGDRKFDNSNTAEAMFGANVESLPVDDDGAALRRELWLRTDEAYKAAVETLAKKRSTAAGQADSEEDGEVADFSQDKPATLKVPFPGGLPEPDQLLDTVTQLSAIPRQFPEVLSCRVTGTYATIRRRFLSSEGARSDEKKGTTRIDVVAETQAADGMRLVDFVTFTALLPSGLPPLAEMQKAARHMVTELLAMRSAPVVQSGSASVLFEGPAAGQIVKLLLGDNLSGTPAPRTAAGGEERGQTSEFAERLGQKVASPLLMAVDDPLRDLGPGRVALYGGYRVDDEGMAAEKVSVVEGGILKGLLMTRTPRKQIAHSNGHARATRFGAPHAAVGNLILSGKPGVPRSALSRAALLTEMMKAGRGGGLGSYIVRLIEDPLVPGAFSGDDGMASFSIGGPGRSAPSVKPLVVYRLRSDGKEELVRGLTLEGLVPRSLKDIAAMGNESVVYNYHDGGAGFVGVPSSVVTPALLFSDVDVRKSVGKNRRPPLYPRPAL